MTMTQTSGTTPDAIDNASIPDSDTRAIAELNRLREQARAGTPDPPKQFSPAELLSRVPQPNAERQKQLDALYSRQQAQKKAMARRAALSSLESAAGSRYVHCRLNNFHAYEDSQARVVNALR